MGATTVTPTSLRLGLQFVREKSTSVRVRVKRSLNA